MQISEIMAQDPLTIPDEATVTVAMRLMDEHGIRHLPVLREGALVGVVSDRDLLGAIGWLRPREEDAHDAGLRIVRDVMHADPVTIDPDTSSEDAAALLVEHDVGCLPVLRERDLVGMLTAVDLLDLVTERHRYGTEGPTDTSASEAMTTEPVTLDGEATLADAYRLLEASSFRHLPVLRDGQLAGMASDRDVRRAMGRDEPRDMRLAEVMTVGASTVTPQTPLSRVARQMSRERIGALPVIGDEGRLVGIVTVSDVLARSFPSAETT